MPELVPRRRTLPLRHALLAAALLLAVAGTAHAQQPGWRVAVASASSGIQPAGFPANVIGLAQQQVAASGTISLQLTTSTEPSTLWTQIPGGGMRPLARPAVNGALDPGRVGAEADHVFAQIWYGDYSVAAPRHLFAATAGAPSQTGASVGLWMNDGAVNVEVARAATDGPLGPNLGPDITLVGSTGSGNRALGRIQMLPGSAFALDAQLDTPLGRRDVILRKALGAATFSACALEGSADPTLAPGVSAPSLDQFVELSGLAQGAGGELYTYGSARLLVLSPTRVGIWRVCQGSPSARALSGDRGALGPGIAGSPLAEFIFFSGELAPLGGGSLLYEARARLDGSSSTSPLIDALFLNDGAGNRPVAVQDTESALGPGIAGQVFNDFVRYRGERGAALVAQVREVGTVVDRLGLWRISAAGTVTPLALLGGSGALAPAPGDTWVDIDDAVALANGDIIAVASSRPNGVNTRALWRFRPGRAPERLFGPGDAVAYRGADGIERSGIVDRIDQLVGSQLTAYAGDEGWINADGMVQLLGRIQGNAATLTFQIGTPLLDRGRVFGDGFEP
jgi:hypothetical protein